MTRIIQQHPTLAVRSVSRLVLAVVALLLTASIADAALTTSACLVQKRKAWGNFRKCQVTEQVKLLKGKPTDLAKCDTALQTALTKITAKATKAVIPCRYGANGDGTVSDHDTGLQWEQKNGEVGGVCLIIFDRPNHCVNYTYSWADAQIFVNSFNGSSTDGVILADAFAGYADWRLPTIAELRTILAVPGCGSGTACIDPIFGPTVAGGYWSATTEGPDPSRAWGVNFFPSYFTEPKTSLNYVRAVRAGL